MFQNGKSLLLTLVKTIFGSSFENQLVDAFLTPPLKITATGGNLQEKS